MVLDSSAVLAVLIDERGSERVRPHFRSGLLSAVNLAEVIEYYALRGATRDMLMKLIADLPQQIVDVDRDLCAEAAMMRPVTRRVGLSVADRICLALAKRAGVPAMTADRAWADVSDELGIDVELIR